MCKRRRREVRSLFIITASSNIMCPLSLIALLFRERGRRVCFLKPEYVFLRGILPTLSNIFEKVFWQIFLQWTELTWNGTNFCNPTHLKNNNSNLLGMIYWMACSFHSISVYECVFKKISRGGSGLLQHPR